MTGVAITPARLRVGFLAVACCVCGLQAGRVFGETRWEFVLVVAIVIAAGVATGQAARWARWTAIGASVTAATAAAVLIGGGSFTDIVPGVGDGPRRLISTEWPSPSDPSAIGAVALLLAIGVAGAVAALRPAHWRLAPVLPVAVVATALIALSAGETTSWWLGLAFAVASAGVAVTGGADGAGAAGSPLVVSLALVAGAATLTGSVVELGDRADPRSTTDPPDAEAVLDPVEASVAMRESRPVQALVRVTSRGQAPLPNRWRVSAYDTYDGQRWSPTADLRPIGGRLGVAPPTDVPTIDYEAQYLGDRLELVPVPGPVIEISADVETDVGRVAVRLPDRLGAGSSIVVRAAPPATVRDAAISGLATRTTDEFASRFVEWADAIASTDASLLDRLGAVAQTMRNDWQLDDAAPGGGHQLALVERFVVETQRGTREQFVTGFVLLARSLGVDARVASGFLVPSADLGESIEIRTEHAAVWPEVGLADGRWLAFDPIPPRSAADTDESPPPPESQTPAAAQPPIAPPVDDIDRSDDLARDGDRADEGWATWRTWTVRVAAGAAILLLPLVIALVTVVGVKWRRRRRRAAAPDPGRRVVGYWASATDAFVDAGLSIGPSWTDDTIARRAADVLGGTSHEARRLAAMASTMTFSTPSDGDAALLANDAAAASAAVEREIRASRTRWERARWRCSLRSLRPATRSPVSA